MRNKMLRRGLKILARANEKGITQKEATEELGYHPNTSKRYIAKAKVMAQALPYKRS